MALASSSKAQIAKGLINIGNSKEDVNFSLLYEQCTSSTSCYSTVQTRSD